MPIPQHIVRDLGGTIDVQLLVRPGVNFAPTVTVRGPTGTLYADAQAATVDAVNTTLSAAPARGDRTVTVGSATGIVVGGEYRVGDGASAPADIVRVRGISGATITLSRPLLNGQAIGSGFVGTRLSFAVTSTQASALFFDGHAEWLWAEGTGTTANRRTMRALECTRVRHERLATAQDAFRRDPKLFYRFPREADIEESLDLAYEDTLDKLGGPFRVRTTIGSHAFIKPTVYRFLFALAAMEGPDFSEKRDYHEKEWLGAVSEVAKLSPVDNDQDAIIESHEGGYQMIRVN